MMHGAWCVMHGRAGYSTVVLTVDVPEVGRRPRELQHDFKMPFRIGQ